jgi:predicted transcriptional regulator
MDTNDAPTIITEDIVTTYEDDLYLVDYDAVDIDDHPVFQWYLKTNASWLAINKSTGELSGTPENPDVGFYYVNITVEDARDKSSSRNFTLEVINTNDAPEWSDLPGDVTVKENQMFYFDINATDVDIGDTLTYDISSEPTSKIKIDRITGFVDWKASLENLRKTYSLKVTVSVTDGIETTWTEFKIQVKPNCMPIAELISPIEGSRVSCNSIELSWKGYDEDGDSLKYDVFLSLDYESTSELTTSALVKYETNKTSCDVDSLLAGKTYYWTVIPNDGMAQGLCNDSILSFVTNHPPEISKISKQKAFVGQRFKFDINAKDENIEDVLNFKYMLESGPEGLEIEADSGKISWIPNSDQLGYHIIKVIVTDGMDQTNTSFVINVIEQEEGIFSISQLMVVMTTISLLAIILGIFISTVEVGKYKFFTSIYVPAYNKLRPDKIFDNYTRGQIHGYIKAKPGEHYNEIKKDLNLKNGILAHHIRILEKEGFIISKRDGFYTRFYSTEPRVKKKDSLKLKKLQKELVEIIRKQPGLTQHEIIDISKLKQQVVSYNLTKLVRDNILEIEQKGREKRYYLNYKLMLSPREQEAAQDQIYSIQTSSQPEAIPGGAPPSPSGGATAKLPPASEPAGDRTPGPEGEDGQRSDPEDSKS